MAQTDWVLQDGGPCQIFGGLYHAVIAQNTAVRSDGFIVEGLLEGWPLSGAENALF
jgi:hypothetical protein